VKVENLLGGELSENGGLDIPDVLREACSPAVLFMVEQISRRREGRCFRRISSGFAAGFFDRELVVPSFHRRPGVARPLIRRARLVSGSLLLVQTIQDRQHLLRLLEFPLPLVSHCQV